MFESAREAIDYIKRNEIEAVDLKACDLQGRWKHVTLPASGVTERTLAEGVGCDGSNYGLKGVGSSDMILKPDCSTAFRDPFWDMPVLSFICGIHETDDVESPCRYDPRRICEAAEERLLSLGAGDRIELGPEYEFYVFDGVSFENSPLRTGFEITVKGNGNGANGHAPAAKGAYHAEQPSDRHASFRGRLCRIIENMGVRVKYHHHEVGGHGQLEIETAFGTPVEMGDATMKIKYAVKNFAAACGMTATFMPKPIFGEPGSGLHVHFKMFREGRPVFSDPKGYSGMSAEALSFITGILRNSRSLSAFANPSINSYKRLVRGYEAPIAAVFAAGNRSAAVRIPGYAKRPEDARFEYRAGDATANPYLMFASLIMAGAEGLRLRLRPEDENAGPAEGNVFEMRGMEESGIRLLPACLQEAAEALEKSHSYLTESGVFPEGLVKFWAESKRAESIVAAPQPIEYELYYDI